MLQQRSDNSQQSVKHGAVIIVPDIVKGYLSALVHCGYVVFFRDSTALLPYISVPHSKCRNRLL